jgi:hypothetical protein
MRMQNATRAPAAPDTADQATRILAREQARFIVPAQTNPGRLFLNDAKRQDDVFIDCTIEVKRCNIYVRVHS